MAIEVPNTTDTLVYNRFTLSSIWRGKRARVRNCLLDGLKVKVLSSRAASLFLPWFTDPPATSLSVHVCFYYC